MLRPLKLNPAPDTVTWEIVRLEFPVLLRDADFDKLVPSGTLPKVTGEGLTDNCPAAAAANRKTLNAQDTHVDKGPIRFTLCFSCSVLKQHGGGFGAALSTTVIKSSQDEVHSVIVRGWGYVWKEHSRLERAVLHSEVHDGQSGSGYVRRILRESRGNPTLDAREPAHRWCTRVGAHPRHGARNTRSFKNVIVRDRLPDHQEQILLGKLFK